MRKNTTRTPKRAFGIFTLAAVTALLASGCPGELPPPASPANAQKARPKEPVVWRTSKSGLGFRLSDAKPEEEAQPSAANVTMLAEADAKRLLARLPAMESDPSDEKDFALRERSRPAPRPGKTVDLPFPPTGSGAPPAVAAAPGPLTISRRAPEGELDLAPSLSVSFSKPMVAITSHDELAKVAPPVTLLPEPPGKWRWLGTQTVVFDPARERFPMSTDYKVEIKAGTRSTDGSTLTRPEVWTFTTPAVALRGHAPSGGSVELEPKIFAGFNQGIDPQSILAAMEVRAGKDRVPVTLLTGEDVEANAQLRALAKRHESKAGEPQRFIAFKPVRPLPKATHIEVRFPEGTPSAEGPKRTTRAQSFGFSTYGPMALSNHHCSWNDVCPPLTPFILDFSNAIDTAAFDKNLVTVSPPLVGMKVDVSGSRLTVSGRSKGRTKYTVTVAAALKDRFGQSLERDATAAFEVGSARPLLFREDSPQIVLDPIELNAAGGPKLSVFSVNRDALRVKLFKVRPEDWGRYLKFRQSWDYDGKEIAPPGTLVQNEVVRPKRAPDELVETSIPLKAALTGGFGQVIALVEPTVSTKDDRQWIRQWIQVTAIGLDVFADNQKGYGWASALANGAPLEGIELSLLPAPGLVKTERDGVARFDLGDSKSGEVVVARKGSDVAMLTDRYDADLSLTRRALSDSIRFFTYDDRRMYKPGEEVHVKGWVRLQKNEIGGDLAAAGAKSLSFKANDPRGSKITEGKAVIDESGGFDFAFKLAKDANLGTGRVELRLDNGHYGSHAFQVQEFRRPEFEVGVSVAGGPHLVGEHAVATVAARYFAGGGLPAAETRWLVKGQAARFTPPNLSNFSFGKPPEPWWRWRSAPDAGDKNQETWTARTSAAGEHRLRIDFDAVEPPYPMNIELQATVTDVNRQEWTARGNLLVHPADLTAGLRSEKGFVRAGEAMPIDVVVSDLDGTLVAGSRVTVRSARLDTEWTPDGYKEKELDAQTCEVTTTKEPVRCQLPTKRGGQHAVTTVVTDVYGRKSQTRIFMWVADDSAPPDRDLTRGKVEVVADKKAYAAGETAELLVLAPFAPAEGVLMLTRQGIVHFERFALTKTSQVLRTKLTTGHYPSVEARVVLVGEAPRDNAAGEPDPSLPKRAAHAVGSTTLSVPPAERTLKVQTVAREPKLDPGSEATIDVTVADAKGRAMPGASVALAVVDEAILALSDAKLPDPIATFYPPRSSELRELRSRDLVWLARPAALRLAGDDSRPRVKNGSVRMSVTRGAGAAGLADVSADKLDLGRAEKPKKEMAEKKSAAPRPVASAAPPSPPSGAAAKDEESAADDAKSPELKLRKDFAALAAWLPRLTTDASGRVQAKVKLPESVTRYRIMAVSSAGITDFGAGESTVTTRLPLMVRPSAPRFLNYGDRFEFPIVLQNQTDAPLDVAVAARAKNARMLDTGGRRVVVAPNDRVEVRVPVGTAKAGTARFQVAAATISGTGARMANDAAELELPVWTPATSEAFATYGTLDEGAIAQKVQMPGGVVKEFGALEITTSSTGLQGLTDAVLYLIRYPFDCNEQISSRMMSIAALRDVLGAFGSKELPKPAVLAESMKADMEKLRTRQHYSGGFSFWGPNFEPYPWVSVHVSHALQRAKSKGYAVPSDVESRSRSFLQNVERWIPAYYHPDSRRAIVAYALYVRHRWGIGDVARAKALIQEAGGVEKLPLDQVGWLLPTLGADATSTNEVEAMRRLLRNRVTETAGAAHFATSYGDGSHFLLHSDRRADGVLLESLIGDQPENDLIPKLVTGLLGHRKAGKWTSTQENAFVLLALDRYFQTYEKQTPNFVGRAWLGEKLAMEQAFQGRSTDRNHVAIPMAVLASLVEPRGGAPVDLVLQKDGVGRLYYRVGMTYAPSDLRPPPTEQGFSVTRVYEGADDAKDVRRDPDGTYRVKAGAKVRIRVSMVAPARRHHVALVDPLPAGLEPMNPALAVTGAIPQDKNESEKKRGVPWWWSRTWYEHQNMRDERAEAFASLLWDGVYEYTYVARATVPGTYVAPPPKAEEMYSPETFGRGAGDRVIVE
ncbi:MAG: hypothetical protein IPG50_15940 [Myxococcales bacterium]|nr:hypothetical protein [Myxococcales bacterium]